MSDYTPGPWGWDGMSDYTPGPWEWVEDPYWGGYSGIINHDGAEVLFPDTANHGDTGAAWFEASPSEADALLIAAAPDLYEACEEAKKVLSKRWFIENDDYSISDHREVNDALAVVLQALAKAEGEPS